MTAWGDSVELTYEGTGSFPRNSSWTSGGTEASENHTTSGSYCAAFSVNGTAYITYNSSLTNVSSISLWGERTSNNTTHPSFAVEGSTDGGSSWTTLVAASTFTLAKNSWTEKVINISPAFTGMVRLKYSCTTTAIKYIDDITITYSGGGSTPTLSSISVKTAPTKTSYTEGEHFDPTGLVITRNYSDDSHSDWTYADHTSDFTFTPSTSTALTTGNTSVTITYGGKSTTQAITVTSGGGGGSCDYDEATSLAVDDEVWIISGSVVMDGAASGHVTSFSGCAGDDYKFTVEEGANSGWFALKSANNDRYIQCSTSGTALRASETKSDAYTDWQLVNISTTYYLKNKATNRYILYYNSDNMRGYTNESQASTVAPIIYKKASDCTTPTAIMITSSASAFVGTPITLTYTGGNGGDVTWTITNGSEHATLSGSTLTPTSAGNVTVKASQAKHIDGLITYCPTSKTQEITISEAPVTIRFFNNGTLLDAQTLVIGSGEAMGASMPTLTSGEACDATSTKFAGWTKQVIEEATTTIDAEQFVDSYTEITENLDLNALWASEDATVSVFDASNTDNITKTSGYNQWSENTTGVIFGGTAASDKGSYFRITTSSGDFYLYIKAPNKVISKYILTVDGAIASYGIDDVTEGIISNSGSIQTVTGVNVPTTNAFSSNTNIDLQKVEVYTYTNFLTHCNRVKQPVISPESGNYYRSGDQSIIMTSATDEASIYYTYTTDGSTPADPTSSSTLYSAAIPFSTFSAGQTIKIKAIAIKGGMSDSRITSVEYVIYEGKCQRPTFTPGGGTYLSAQNVVINSTDGATIYYTTDGTDPSSSGTRLEYSSAIEVTLGETTLKAYAEKAGYVPSDVATALYTVEQPYMITYHVPAGYAAPTAEYVASTTLPTGIVEPCDDWRFVGWSTTNITSQTETATVLSEEYHPTSDVNLYAVYATEVTTAGAAKYNKVTAALTDYSGDYLIVYETDVVAFDGGLTTLDAAGNTVDVSISDGTITATSAMDAAKFTITKTIEGYTIVSASGKYIGKTADSNGMNESASALYNTISVTSGNADIVGSGGAHLRYNSASSDLRFRYYKSTTYTSQKAIQLYKRAGGVTKTYYISSPTCTPCTEAAVTLSQTSVLLKSEESTSITVTTNNTSEIVIEIGDLDVAEASITGNTITITAVNDGTTELTIRQNRDKTDIDHPICAVTKVVPVTVKDALIDVVEVGPDFITIEHDYGGGTTITMQEQLVTLDGDPAEDLFFSKYYEAASNMKLFAIYNGTEDPIDLSKIRIRSVDNTDVTKWANGNGKLNYVELGTIARLKKDHKNFMLEPFTEIVFWSNNKGSTSGAIANNRALRECIKMQITVNGVETTFKYEDLANDRVPNWYCLGDSVTYSNTDGDGNNQFIFNGDDALIMERDSTDWGKSDWYPIDLIGAGTKAGPNNSACDEITTTYSIGGTDQPLNDDPGWYTAVDGEGNAFAIPYSTNRYLLTRKKSVKSGANAVKLNKTDFETLKTEWNGIAVGGSNADVCYSGKQFSVVGQYDYANYYSEFRTLDASEAIATPQSDGTVKVTIPDLVDRACDYLNIQVKDGEDIAAETKYKVPIIVQSPKATTDDIFYNEGEKGCKRCDVVVLSGATLTKAADGTTHDMPEVRDMEVYVGGKLIVPEGANYNYTVRSLTIRSNEDNVGSARINGTLITDNIYHDKRMKGGSAGRWYWICLPYACNIKDVNFRSGESAIYGTDWWLQVYDGQERVNTASGAQNGWKMVKPGELKQLQPGVGYIVAVASKDGHTFGELRFPMAGYQESSTKYVSVDDYGAGVSVTPNHKGWNLVGNPFMDYYLKGNLTGQGLTLGRLKLNTEGTAWEIETPATVPYITLPVDGGYSEYTQVTANSMDLPPFISYFVQIAGSDPDADESDLKVAFDPSQRGVSPAPRRYVEPDENDPIWVAVALRNSNEEKDETTLVISDNYTDDYEIGGDLYKWRGAYYKYAQFTTKPVLASRNEAGEMAFNAVPDNTAKAGVPLNYFAAANGEYTFSFKRDYSIDHIENVMLVDMQEGITTNLLDNDYTFYSSKGDNTSRFKLIVNVNRAPNATTGFEHLGYSDAPRKLLINGHVYIQRGNAIYDVTGKQLFNR